MAKKVLIIDDNPTDAAIVKEIMIREGLEVAVATSGKEGIRKALEIRPDLILLDLVMPDISGFEVCSQIKKEVRLANSIVVILSIKDKLEDIQKAFEVDADDYVIKPPEPEFLVRKVKLYLGIR